MTTASSESTKEVAKHQSTYHSQQGQKIIFNINLIFDFISCPVVKYCFHIAPTKEYL